VPEQQKSVESAVISNAGRQQNRREIEKPSID